MKLFKRIVEVIAVPSLLLCCVYTALALADIESETAAEIAEYKQGIQTLSGDTLIELADLLSGSGIVDDELYIVVENKTKDLYEQHLYNPKDRQLARDLNAVLRTYGSFGRSESRDFIISVVDGAKSRGVRNRAHRLHPKLDWYSKRNQLMQDTTYYREGQDLMTHRFASLVASDDSRMRRWAVQEIERRGGTEAIVYQQMANALKNEAKNIRSDLHLDALAWFCKTLARFDLQNNRDLLLSIQEGEGYHKKLKKYAKF